MAKEAQEREDLMRDASGLPVRVELKVPRESSEGRTADQTVVCGFRESGALSVYWGQTLVLQFNADQELRRAYWSDQMVASYKHSPHWLKRNSSGGRVRLERQELTPIERDDLSAVVEQCLDRVHRALADGHAEVVAQIPTHEDVAGKVLHWLEHHRALNFALHPGVGRKQRGS